MIKYRMKWQYSDLKEGQTPESKSFEIHFSFLLRFPEIPPGEGHTAHFSFNVISPFLAREQGILAEFKRGYIITELFSYSEVIKNVEETVHHVFSCGDISQALNTLNKVYIHSELNFSNEFKEDVLDAHTITKMIEEAFDGVGRGEGITLHEALAIDDWKSEEERKQARKLDSEQRWQDVPGIYFKDNPSYLSFLDAEGFRYYLPAHMTWALKTDQDDPYDTTSRLMMSLLPVIAPRDQGKGWGKNFDVKQFIENNSFTSKQVRAIYHFLCFVAVEDKYQISEDDYPAMLQWRKSAFQLP